MRPTFMGLETTKRGLMVQQKALDIIANNVSNVKTKGYTRQRLDTVTVQVYGSDRFAGSSIPLAGQGVDMKGVAQIRDSFLDSKFRQEYGDVGYYDQSAVILDEIQAAISDPEVDGSGIQNALKMISQALSDFSGNPQDETHANIVMNSFMGLTQVLNEYDTKLKGIRESQIYDLSVSVNDINTKLAQLTDLNKTITHEIFLNTDYDGVVYGPNDLLDQRNVILDELARYGDVKVSNKSDGSIQVKFNGQVVVESEGGNFWNDSIKLADDGVSMKWNRDNRTVALPTGSLRSYNEALTGDNSLNKGIPYYQHKLDTMASKLAEVFNRIIPETYQTADPKIPDTYKKLLQGDEDGNVTAGNISISDVWANDASYLLEKNNPSGQMATDNILSMKKLLDDDLQMGEFNGSFYEYVTHVTTTLGTQISTNDARLKSCVATANSVDTDRMSQSGVSLNEEGVNMMSYNKAYQALGRLMTTMDEQLDILINSVGLVGR
ncbi:flagellar hook-associated protein FlgK [[Clostridium] symbiosum]|uniref:flagellar hook-associated protein FlgK n=1 Tax=Clostridium symbiosum TaxID=1512 RepID=UPI001D097199|nr:flagellar hook-associated protein FlgK [[Clostridium] symbiosum]MCB6609801.1 flagellar hook-associated protein FlgK [[Clostridium] symbiosum]MCB6931243.1 flagellar hook-associated protein FlgK [[Clostridium] symbiosum]